MHHYLNLVYWNNRVIDYLVAGELLCAGLTVVWGLRLPMRRWLGAQDPAGLWPKLAGVASPPLFQMFQALTLFVALEHLRLRHGTERLIHIYAAAMIAIGLARLVVRSARFLMLDYGSRKRADGKTFERQFRGLIPVMTIAVWGGAAVCLLDNLGVNISAVVAGLGIGGVAIALASQTILADLFAYFAILFDRPFDIDDVIMVDHFTGTVEYIGIKTTRVRSVGGEQLVLSNSDLTKSRVRNYRRMQTRRVERSLSIAYECSVDQLEMLPKWIGELVAGHEQVKLDYVYITDLSATSLELNIAYVVLNESASKHLEIQQSLLLAIKRELDARGIALAMPMHKLVFHEAANALPGAPQDGPRELVSGDAVAA